MLNLARMNRPLVSLLCFLCCALFFTTPSSAQFQGHEFVQNKGQWPADVQFMAKDGAAKIWMGQDRFLYQLTDFSALEKAHHEQKILENPLLTSRLVQQRFKGVNPHAQAMGHKPAKHAYNFFLGSDSSRWASGVGAYGEVGYQDYYPGIDMFWKNDQANYKYLFVVAPGSAPAQIMWDYTGADAVILRKGSLLLKTAIL